MTTFSDLPLLPTLLESLTEQGITRPTDIQGRTLPPLLEGRPLVGVAETGSGKTLAYVLPLLHRLKVLEHEGSSVSEPGRPRGLVLVPGRELGEQVSKVCKGLTHRTRLRVRTVLGGTRKQIARQNVGAPHEILVATPGRLVQLLDSHELRLDDVRTLVLDEADQLLDPGFLSVVRRVLKACPPQVQLVLFSATLPQTLDPTLATLFRDTPVRVRTKGSQKLVPSLTVENITVSKGDRDEALRDLFGRGEPVGTLVFANTREQCAALGAFFDAEGIPWGGLFGEMERNERRRNLAMFRDGALSVLLTTDLGGRGLDIDRVERVVNAHLPRDVGNYLHRAGRTARAGRPGLVVNLVTQRDQPLLAKLRNRT
jgi:ATP-dependent RNA helicase RhlE